MNLSLPISTSVLGPKRSKLGGGAPVPRSVTRKRSWAVFNIGGSLKKQDRQSRVGELLLTPSSAYTWRSKVESNNSLSGAARLTLSNCPPTSGTANRILSALCAAAQTSCNDRSSARKKTPRAFCEPACQSNSTFPQFLEVLLLIVIFQRERT